MSRGRLEAEVIALRYQLNILRRQSPRRVRPNAFDRAIVVCLYRYFPDMAMPSRLLALKLSFAGTVWVSVRGGVGSLGIQAQGQRRHIPAECHRISMSWRGLSLGRVLIKSPAAAIASLNGGCLAGLSA